MPSSRQAEHWWLYDGCALCWSALKLFCTKIAVLHHKKMLLTVLQ